MLIAGPCGIESRDQALKIAKYVKSCGANVFRGGIWKGQNRPFPNGVPEYLGIGSAGIPILNEIQDTLGLPCVCDVQTVQQAYSVYGAGIEYLMVGARNMDNLALLREINSLFNNDDSKRKIILKRGPSATIDEWIGAAEHLGGPERVILCERGTVHFDRHDYTRFRLDFVGVAEVREYYPEYQVIVDPSHGCGNRYLVHRLSQAALQISDGLMIETHYDPDTSPTDAPQTVGFPEFKRIADMYKEYNYGKK